MDKLNFPIEIPFSKISNENKIFNELICQFSYIKEKSENCQTQFMLMIFSLIIEKIFEDKHNVIFTGTNFL